MEIKNIIFDLGGVLIDWNPKYLFRKIFDSEAEIDWFLGNICTYDWNLHQDAGRTWAEATQELIVQFPKYESQILAYASRWEEMLGGEISETVNILRELKQYKKHHLFALTNWSAETFPIAQRKFGFLGWFEGTVVSGVEKTGKPFPEIYHILLDRFGLNPAQSVFIDDSLPNVEMAEKLGIKGIHFQSPAQLRQDLSTLLH